MVKGAYNKSGVYVPYSKRDVREAPRKHTDYRSDKRIRELNRQLRRARVDVRKREKRTADISSGKIVPKVRRLVARDSAPPASENHDYLNEALQSTSNKLFIAKTKRDYERKAESRILNNPRSIARHIAYEASSFQHGYQDPDQKITSGLYEGMVKSSNFQQSMADRVEQAAEEGLTMLPRRPGYTRRQDFLADAYLDERYLQRFQDPLSQEAANSLDTSSQSMRQSYGPPNYKIGRLGL